MSLAKITFIQLTAIVLLLCFVDKGSSIRCWECTSDSNPKCADPFDNLSIAITDCSLVQELKHLPGDMPPMCRKIRQKVNGEWRYFRNCAYRREPDILEDERFFLMRTGNYNTYLEFYTCNSKDGCNSASGLYHSAIFQFGSVLATIIATWFLRT